MWCDLHDLFPGVDVDQRAEGLSPSSLSPLVGADPLTGAPAAAACAPMSAAAPPSGCARGGCPDPPAGDWTGRCEAHSMAWLDRAFDLTRGIGRGELS